MKKIISFILILAMILSVSSVAFAVSVTTADAQSELDNAVSGDVTLDLAAGNYELKFTLGKGTESNVDTTTDYYYRATYTRTHGSLIFESSQNATIDGLSLGVATGGHTQLIIGGALTDAVVEQKYDIGILKFTGVVFNDIVDIDLTDDCDIDEIIFENVTFNMNGQDNISEAAAYIHDDNAADSDLPKVTFKNCVFNGCGELAKPIHIVSQSATDADIIIEDCIIDGTDGNAIQIAGVGPYTGDISIINNKISNTKDRGIRISKTTDKAKINIEGNELVNATRTNGEVEEAIKIDGEAEITVKNNTLDGQPIPQTAVIAEDTEKLTVTYEAPAPSPDTSDDPDDDKPTVTPTPKPKPTEKPASSGIKVEYNGGNSFSTSKSNVPTSVEIDGVAVPFTGDGRLFTVNSIPAGAKWVTVRWNSTSVTTNFTPYGAYAAEVEIPKTGDISLWAAVLAFFGF